jgi:hypothetical protein
MGYRSDVVYVMAFPSKSLRNEFLSVQKIGARSVVEREELDELQVIDADGGNDNEFLLAFETTCVKWYEEDGFEDVDIHHRLMDACTETPWKGAYYFTRVGENHEDIEHKEGSWWDDNNYSGSGLSDLELSSCEGSYAEVPSEFVELTHSVEVSLEY